MLSRLKPRSDIAANVPTMEAGSARLGMTVAEMLRRNRKMTITTSAMVSTIVNLMSWTDSRIDCDRSLRTASVERGRKLRLDLRQQLADRVDDLDRVRARLPLHGQVDRPRFVVPARRLVVFDAVVDVRELVEPHRPAVAVAR